jgi:hypothetical protein
MSSLLGDLAPLVLVSAALPAQTIVTLLLVHSSIRAAYAWVAGMTMVRLLQGFLFGLVLGYSGAQSKPDSPQYILAAVLSVLALFLYVKAFRAATGGEDRDTTPPRWIKKASTMSPRAAFGAGAGFMALSLKLLVFTLGAISTIAEAHLGLELSLVAFVVFVVSAHGVPFFILALASSTSPRSTAILDGLRAWLKRRQRAITVILGLIFGTWFLLKSIKRLGVI